MAVDGHEEQSHLIVMAGRIIVSCGGGPVKKMNEMGMRKGSILLR